jgi:hypothetical protein
MYWCPRSSLPILVAPSSPTLNTITILTHPTHVNVQALVYLSFDEGFGLPVAEALACGCPVIASHIPAVLEVGLRH